MENCNFAVVIMFSTYLCKKTERQRGKERKSLFYLTRSYSQMCGISETPAPECREFSCALLIVQKDCRNLFNVSIIIVRTTLYVVSYNLTINNSFNINFTV